MYEPAPSGTIQRTLNRKVEYIPPSPDAIRRYTHAICRQLHNKHSSPVPYTELAQELMMFVQVIVRIQAKDANRRKAHA